MKAWTIRPALLLFFAVALLSSPVRAQDDAAADRARLEKVAAFVMTRGYCTQPGDSEERQFAPNCILQLEPGIGPVMSPDYEKPGVRTFVRVMARRTAQGLTPQSVDFVFFERLRRVGRFLEYALAGEPAWEDDFLIVTWTPGVFAIEREEIRLDAAGRGDKILVANPLGGEALAHLRHAAARPRGDESAFAEKLIARLEALAAAGR